VSPASSGPGLFQPGKFPEAQGFVKNDGNGVGEIERSGPGTHRDAEAPPGPSGKQALRKSLRFLSEHEKRVFFDGHFPERARGLCREKQALLGRGFPKKRFEVVMKDEVHVAPIIRPRPPQAPVGENKTQRLDQMKARSGGGAGPGDVPGILGNFRLDERYIKQ